MSSNPQSIFLRIQYPEKIGLLCDDSLDQFLTSLQRSQPLFNYTCTLITLMIPSSQTVSKDVPSLYSKQAPAYASGGSGELEPVLLAELIFVMDLPVSEVTTIITVVNDLIKKQLLSGRPQVTVRILTMSLSSGVAKYASSEGSHLPLQYCHHHPSDSISKTHFYIVILAIMCLVVVVYFAIHFHHNNLP